MPARPSPAEAATPSAPRAVRRAVRTHVTGVPPCPAHPGSASALVPRRRDPARWRRAVSATATGRARPGTRTGREPAGAARLPGPRCRAGAGRAGPGSSAGGRPGGRCVGDDGPRHRFVQALRADAGGRAGRGRRGGRRGRRRLHVHLPRARRPLRAPATALVVCLPARVIELRRRRRYSARRWSTTKPPSASEEPCRSQPPANGRDQRFPTGPSGPRDSGGRRLSSGRCGSRRVRDPPGARTAERTGCHRRRGPDRP